MNGSVHLTINQRICVNRNSGRTWINFKELRARLKAEDVLLFYNIELRRKGEQHQSTCPLPSHSMTNSMNSFSVNLEKGIFQCFGCKAKGNILEFAALMDGVDPADGSALRKVAVKLQAKFFPEGASTRTAERAGDKVPAPKPPELKLAVNVPLDFELKGLEGNHPFLTGKGYTGQTMAHFGIGFCSRGFLKDRIAVPLHDEEGRLIGYAGLVINQDDAGGRRYLFPEKRERNGTILDFDKSLFLYNGSRIKAPCDNLVVVQDPEAVWWLNQHGFPTSVALMGNECSETQIELIVRLVNPGGWIWVMCDDDDNGDRLAQWLLFRAAAHRPVRRVRCGEGRMPAQMSAGELKACFVN